MTSLRAGYRLLNALLIVNESGSFRILLLDIYFITLQLFGRQLRHFTGSNADHYQICLSAKKF